MGTLTSEPFVDTRNSCTADFAVALMLGRRAFDGHYPDYKASEDSQNPEDPYADVVAHEDFLEFLDTSIFEILAEERDTIALEKEDAIDAKADIAKDGKRDKKSRIEALQQTIDACNRKLVESTNTEVLARKYLRDIADELANKVNPMLREDTTQTHGVHITLASLERWIDKAYPKEFRSALKQGLAPPVAATPVGEVPYDLKEDQLDAKGRMNKQGRDSLYLTLGVLIHRYFELTKEVSCLLASQPGNTANPSSTNLPNIWHAQQCLNNDGSVIDLAFAKELSRDSKPYGRSDPVRGQGFEAILGRVEEAMEIRAIKIDKRPQT